MTFLLFFLAINPASFYKTKPITILHTYAIMRLYGDELYRQNVDTLYDLGSTFAGMIRQAEHMELALDPSCNIVCFRYVPEKGDAETVNRKILDALLKDGSYYVVGTAVRGEFYLRVSLMNPLTDEACLADLIQRIQILGAEQEA